MEIRLATEPDLQELLKYDRHIQPEKLRDCILGNLVYVMLDGSQVRGVLRFNLFWQTIPFLDHLFIGEIYRNQGWGRKAMHFWEESMKHLGYTYAMLSTQEDETAKYFYEKLGYRRIGAFLPPDQEADEIIYGKELSR